MVKYWRRQGEEVCQCKNLTKVFRDNKESVEYAFSVFSEEEKDDDTDQLLFWQAKVRFIF